jgi:hypothetical protein
MPQFARPLSASLLFLAALTTGASAIVAGGGDALDRKVYLKCGLENSKIVVVTNSTDKIIAAGTKISFSTLRRGSAARFDGSFASPDMAPGAYIKRPAVDSVSCTAWYVSPLLMRAP